MKKLTIIVLTATLLSSCAVTDFFWKAVKPGGGVTVDTELVNGDKDVTVGDNTKIESNEGTINTSKTDTEQVISGNNSVTIENAIPVWMYLVLILGWMAPSPSVIYTEMLRLIKRK